MPVTEKNRRSIVLAIRKYSQIVKAILSTQLSGLQNFCKK